MGQAEKTPVRVGCTDGNVHALIAFCRNYDAQDRRHIAPELHSGHHPRRRCRCGADADHTKQQHALSKLEMLLWHHMLPPCIAQLRRLGG